MKPLKAGLIAVSLLSAISNVRAFGQREGGGTSTSPQQATPAMPSINTNRPSFPYGPGSDPAMGMPGPLDGRVSEQQAKTRNNERQKRLQSDTDKLLGLVTDLKSQVQSEKEVSPAELSRRAEEIEKLARSVKDKMRG